MRDDPVVIDLVTRARDGDQRAWDGIVDRYAPLVWSICRRYQLSRQDTDDIGQTVWLALVEQLVNLRQPAALPGWLATTTQRECFRVLRAARRHGYSTPLGESQPPLGPPPPMIEETLIEAELSAALRAAFAQLPARCQQLLSMLISDPPHSYAEISAALPIPVGSIGPQRARCLDRLRGSPFLAGFSDRDIPDNAGANGIGGGQRA